MAFTACKKEDRNYNTRITILNAVPNSAGFKFVIGVLTLDSTAVYGTPKYDLSAAAATALIQWKKNNTVGFDTSFVTDLPNGNDFTMLFYDSLKRYKSYFVRDVWQQPASETKGYIRFFPMVINGNQMVITNDTNKVLISSQSFGNFQSTGALFNALDTFHTKLRLYNNGVLLDSIPDAELLPGKSYTIYAVGVLKASGDKRPKMIIHEHE